MAHEAIIVAASFFLIFKRPKRIRNKYFAYATFQSFLRHHVYHFQRDQCLILWETDDSFFTLQSRNLGFECLCFFAEYVCETCGSGRHPIQRF